jgi:hypothetical protein
MTIDVFRQKQSEITQKYSQGWTAHNIWLTDNEYTISNSITCDEVKLRRIIQTISDFIQKPFNQLRILDLALLEGLYGIECARQGANVLGLDIRQENLDKTQLVLDFLELSNMTLVLDDVRNISTEKYGSFDVVLCLGILYHLDYNDIFDFLNKIYNITTNLVIFDTHISFSHNHLFSYKNIKYYGVRYLEHPNKKSNSEKIKDVWKSIDNNYSAYLTRSSFINMLSQIGFTSASEVYLPGEPDKPLNRITLAAFKGKKIELISSPSINEDFSLPFKEHTFNYFFNFYKIIFTNKIRYNLGIYLPKPIKIFLKYFLSFLYSKNK